MVIENLNKVKEILLQKGFQSRISQSEDKVKIFISLNQRYSFDKFNDLFIAINDINYNYFPQINWSSKANIERADDGKFEMSIEFKKSEWSNAGGTYYKKPEYIPTTHPVTLTKGPVFITFPSIRSYITDGWETKEEFTLLEIAYLGKTIKDIDPNAKGPSDEYKGGLSWTMFEDATIYIDKYSSGRDPSPNRYLVMWSKNSEYKYYILFDINEFSKLPLPEFQKALSKSTVDKTSQTVIRKITNQEYINIKKTGEMAKIMDVEEEAISDKLKNLLINSRSNLRLEKLPKVDQDIRVWYLYEGYSVKRRIELTKIRPLGTNNFKFFVKIQDTYSKSIDVFTFYYINSILRLPESLFK